MAHIILVYVFVQNEHALHTEVYKIAGLRTVPD